MEEIEASSFFLSLDILNRQLIVLFQNLWNILFPDGIWLFWSSHNRLDGHLLESQICKMDHIVGEIQIISGKGSADIIIHLVSALCELLEFWNNDIIASGSLAEWTHLIVDFFSAV